MKLLRLLSPIRFPDHLATLDLPPERPLWFVVFIPKSADSWQGWARLALARDRWSHVLACALPASGCGAVTVDPMSWVLAVSWDPQPVGDKLAWWVRERGATIVGMPCDIRRRPRLPFLLTCVEVVRHLTGVGGWFCWTPGQLYRALIRAGGEDLTATLTTTTAKGAPTMGGLMGGGGPKKDPAQAEALRLQTEQMEREKKRAEKLDAEKDAAEAAAKRRRAGRSLMLNEDTQELGVTGKLGGATK